MARRRPIEQVSAVRAHLRDHAAEMAARYGHMTGCPWPRQVEALDAGEPVTVHVWQLPGKPSDWGMTPGARVVVDRHGNVTRAARPVR